MPATKRRISEEQKQNLLHWSQTAEGERAAARDIMHKVLEQMGGVDGVANNIALLMQEGGNSVAKQRAVQEFMRLLNNAGNRLGPPPDLGLATEDDLTEYLARLIDERLSAQEGETPASHNRPKNSVMVAQEAEAFVASCDDWENVTTFLAQHRRDKKIDQTKIAKKLKLTQSRFSHFETGAGTPTISTLAAWAKALDLKLAIGIMPDKKPEPSPVELE